MTITIRPRFDWQFFLTIAWLCFIGYQAFLVIQRKRLPPSVIDIVLFAVVSFALFLSLIRRERIEIYSDQMIWRRTYFGITSSNVVPLSDVLGAEWIQAEQHGEGRGPDHIEFYLTNGSVRACFGLKFEEFDRMREEIRTMYPDLIKRWGNSSLRSKDLTLLNLS